MARPRKLTPSTASPLTPALRTRLLGMARDDGAREALAGTLDRLRKKGGVNFERVAEALYSAQVAIKLERFDAQRVVSRNGRDTLNRTVDQLFEALTRASANFQGQGLTGGPVLQGIADTRDRLANIRLARDLANPSPSQMGTLRDAFMADATLFGKLWQQPRGRGRPFGVGRWLRRAIHPMLREAGVTAEEDRDELIFAVLP